MSVGAPSCRFCGRRDGGLVEDPALGATRVRAGGVVDRRQTWHHVACLHAASGLREMPFPASGGEIERARLRRKAAAMSRRRAA